MQTIFKKIQNTSPGGLGVTVINNDLRTALRIFRQEVIESKVLNEVHQRKYYKPKSQKKKEMMENAKYLEQFKHN